MKLNNHKKIYAGLLLLLLGFWPAVLCGEMSSESYRIFADDFNVGGVYSTSTSYALNDSIGEWPSSLPTSTSYEIRAGFQAMEKGELSLTISDTTLNLGSLSVSAVSSDSATITVSSASETGYTLSITSADSSPIGAVSDGEVTAGSEEYGVAISGTGASFPNDQSIIAGRILATSSLAVSNNVLTMTVKASRTATTAYGSKTQNIVLGLSGNF